MKHWNVRKKLFFSLSIVTCLGLLIAIGGASGMRSLHGQLQVLSNTTLPNTERVWEIMSNLQSEATYLLLAVQEPDTRKIEEYLQKGNADLDRNRQLLEEFSKSPAADSALLQQINQCLQQQESVRKEFHTLALQNNEDSNRKAIQLLNDRMIPLLSQEADLLRKAIAAQDARSSKNITDSENLYYLLKVTTPILVAVSMIASVWISRRLQKAILPPLQQVRDAAQAMVQADFNFPILYQSRDEFGQTCDALRASQQALKRVVEDECYILNEMADGNFNVRSAIPEQYVGGLEPIRRSIIQINHRLSDTIAQIDAGANQVAAGADQVAQGAQSLAQGTTEQASAVEELSATLADISQKSDENAQYTVAAMEHAVQGGQYVQQSAVDVQEMVSAMAEISTSSEEIRKIIATIESIAFQTNILALNAAVEAARAGSAGKGFSVVADEVRNLAGRSDEAAKATKELIGSSLSAVAHGDSIVHRVTESLNSTMEASSRSVEDIKHIAEAVKNEAKSISQISQGLDAISAVVQTNSATSEQSAAASEEVSSQAAMVKQVLAQFTLRDDTVRFEEPAVDYAAFAAP